MIEQGGCTRWLAPECASHLVKLIKYSTQCSYIQFIYDKIYFAISSDEAVKNLVSMGKNLC